MSKELINAIKTIITCCASNNDCDICPLMYWCDNEFGMNTPAQWAVPEQE